MGLRVVTLTPEQCRGLTAGNLGLAAEIRRMADLIESSPNPVESLTLFACSNMLDGGVGFSRKTWQTQTVPNRNEAMGHIYRQLMDMDQGDFDVGFLSTPAAPKP